MAVVPVEALSFNIGLTDNLVTVPHMRITHALARLKARFRTPIKNLYMCGSATHPGGGIMGAPGQPGRVLGAQLRSHRAASTDGSRNEARTEPNAA